MNLPKIEISERAPLADILLASGSAIRRALLENAGVPVRTVPHHIDERQVASEADGGAAEVALYLAEQKAMSASAGHPDAFVVGADQTLEFDERVLGKPANLREARDRLRSLSNKTHQLHAAFAIVHAGNVLAAQVQSASLTMRALSDEEIDWYLGQTGSSVLTSVGAYQLEGLGIRLFAEIEGNYFTILGLPMLPLLSELRRVGAIGP